MEGNSLVEGVIAYIVYNLMAFPLAYKGLELFWDRARGENIYTVLAPACECDIN
jgi:hypothetical protein